MLGYRCLVILVLHGYDSAIEYMLHQIWSMALHAHHLCEKKKRAHISDWPQPVAMMHQTQAGHIFQYRHGGRILSELDTAKTFTLRLQVINKESG